MRSVLPHFSAKGPIKPKKRPPGKPTGVTVEPYQTGRNARLTLEISWTANPNGNKAITNHEIEWSPNGTSDWKDLRTVSGQLTNTLFTGLSPGTTRHIRIRSADDDGDGPWSDVVSGTTNGRTIPGPITGLTATAASPSMVNLSWTGGDDGGSPITGYDILVYQGADLNAPLFTRTAEASATSYSVTGLSAATQYTFIVRAKNSIGTNKAFVNQRATTAALTAPAAPTGLTATADGRTTINLRWTAPTNTGGAAITGYKIESRLRSETSFSTLVPDTKTTKTDTTHTGLAPSTQRFYRVRAINSVGAGAASSSATAITAAPSRPSAPRNLTATASGRTTIILNWTAPADDGGSPITYYRVGVSTNQGTSWTGLADVRGATTYSHTGLSAGTRRDYRVVAANSSGRGFSDRSNVANATTAAATAPGVPRNVTATADGQTVINLTWDAPADNGGAAITGYQIFISETGSPLGLFLFRTTRASPINIPGSVQA